MEDLETLFDGHALPAFALHNLTGRLDLYEVEELGV
jgi:hypothetical protein